MRLYYLYEKSPKRCRELEDIITDLKMCFSFEDGGVRPVHSSGTRWVSHKQSAMNRVISNFSAYTSHLASLSEDKSVNSGDRAKLKGYYLRWTDAKYLLGCALFVDLLKPCECFSKCMQNEEIDILGAITALLKTKREIEKLGSNPLDQWPTYAKVCANCEEEDGSVIYQCQILKNFSEAQTFYSSKYQEYSTAVNDHITSRLSWYDMQLMRDIIVMLSSHGWEKLVLEGNDLSTIERLTERFNTPLQHAKANINDIKPEFAAMIEYATEFVAISSLHYQSVWWRMFHAPNSSDWTNALKLAEILFSLPVSNGKVERVFSTASTIKVDKRSRMSSRSLDDLLLLNTPKLPISSFNPDPSIDLWWSSKTRRPSQKAKQSEKTLVASTSQEPRSKSLNPEDSEDDEMLILDCWDTLMLTNTI